MIINSEEKKISERERRGQISKENLDLYLEFSDDDLRVMLKNDDPQKRTAAATILGNRQDKKAILALCNTLKIEKSLYSRIAMSEALGKIGEPSVGNLINLIGIIGNNQELNLPSKYFKKKSFPLQRDMAVRTLVKVGTPATHYLINLLEKESDIFIIEQTIDAVGGIAANTGDKRGFSVIISTLKRFSDDNLVVWKCVRALSGFRLNIESSETLLKVLKSDYEAPIIWETLVKLVLIIRRLLKP